MRTELLQLVLALLEPLGAGHGNRFSGSQFGLYYNPVVCSDCVHQSNPPQVHGTFAGGGGATVSVGGAAINDLSSAAIYRDGVENIYFLQGASSDADSIQRGIALIAHDFLGAASDIFIDPNGGLDLWQAINWMAQGAYFSVFEYHVQSDIYSVFQEGRFNSKTIQTSVPEPDSVTLVAVALLGVVAVASRRRETRR